LRMRILALTSMTLLINSGVARAMTTTQYAILQESLYVLFSAVCLLLAVTIFLALRGGSLGLPWVFIIAGFGLAVFGATIHLLDVLRIVLHQYDLRMGIFLSHVGSAVLLMVGLILYKKGLG